MRLELNPTGCKIRNGKLKVRVDFFLEENDARYEECVAEVPVSEDDAVAWLATLSLDREGNYIFPDPYAPCKGYPGEKKKRLNPFAFYLFYVPDEVSNEEIMDEAEKVAKEAYKQWKKKEGIKVDTQKVKPRVLEGVEKINCEAKLFYLKCIKVERKIEEE